MIKEVAKINIVGEKKYFNKVMNALHSLGTVEIAESKNEIKNTPINDIQYTDELSKIDYKIAQTNFAIKFLEKEKIKFKKETEKKTNAQVLREMIIKPKIKITEKKLNELLAEYDWKNIISECEETEEKTNNAQNTIHMLKEKENELTKWKGIEISSKDTEETKKTKTFLSETTISSYAKMDFILSSFPLTTYRKVKNRQKTILVLITYAKETEKTLIEHLNKNGISLIEIPRLEKSPEEEIKKIHTLIKEEEKKIKEAKTQTKELLKEENAIKTISDWLNWEKNKIKTAIHALKTNFVFCISAWVAKDNLEALKSKIKNVSPKILVEEAKINEDESQIPVIYKNKDIAQPFEMVTEMYGAPLYNEPDPTPFLAPFFILFFALAITDAMYGAILAILAWGAIKFLKIPKENQKLFKIIFYGGIITFIVGALFGGWFGLVLEELPLWIGTPLIKIRMINPMTDTMKFLIFTFILGIIQIVSGIAVGMYWKFKQGKILDGIMDNGFWMLLILSLAGFAGASSTPAGVYFKIAALISAGLLILTQGRDANNILMKGLKGVLSLYNITAYFSDMLSYSRLLALGLATGIIAMVVNIIAGITSRMIPFVGWIIAIGVLIVGHLFNIAINVLGAYIHSSRLQYVEFFPKFMEGGGKAFQPFRQESKYVKVIEK